MKPRNPAKNYEGLLKQFNALYTLVESKESQTSLLSAENEELRKELRKVNHEEINALRDENERLTNLLED